MRLKLALLIISGLSKIRAQNPPFTIINPVVEDGEGGTILQVLKATQLDKAIESNVPVFVRDLYKFLLTEPPVKVNYRRPRFPVSIRAVEDNYLNSLLPDCTPEEFEGGNCGCKQTYPEVYGIESQSLYSQGTVAINKKLRKLVISYRGTKNVQNNINDLSYSLIDSPNLPYGAQVAEGFYSYHLSVFHSLTNLLEPMLNDPTYQDYTIQITGYSLGAAAAMAGVPDWIQFLKNRGDRHKLEVYGYSGPRSGNSEFARYINQLNIPVIRYTNYNDLVPQFPPRSANFVHAGVEVYQTSPDIARNGSINLKICNTVYDEDPECSWSHHENLDFGLHVKPFSHPIVSPPFC